jgi:hypothetical protein
MGHSACCEESGAVESAVSLRAGIRYSVNVQLPLDSLVGIPVVARLLSLERVG